MIAFFHPAPLCLRQRGIRVTRPEWEKRRPENKPIGTTLRAHKGEIRDKEEGTIGESATSGTSIRARKMGLVRHAGSGWLRAGSCRLDNDGYCLLCAASSQNADAVNAPPLPCQYPLNVPLRKPSIVSERFSFSRSITQLHEGRVEGGREGGMER